MGRVGWILGVLVAAVVVGVGNAGVRAAAAAGPPSCLVSNERTGFGARSLQSAIDAAAAGDTLIVKGTCYGAATIDKDLTLRGVSNKQFGPATLDGTGFSGPVLNISLSSSFSGVAVGIHELTITHGTAGGIHSAVLSALELTGTTVRANSEFGISHDGYGPTTLTDSTVSSNGGQGVTTGSAGVVTVTRSRVTNNTGSGILSSGQEIVVDGSVVSGNGGTGIVNALGPAARISDSTINGNGQSGISVFDASLLLSDSTVSGNSSSFGGGGILLNVNSAGTIVNSTISGNTTSGNGGGIYVGLGYLELNGVTISGNMADGDGGGVYFIAGGLFSYPLRIADSTVISNTASSGGGIFFTDISGYSSALLSGTNTITDNVPDDCVGLSGC